MSDTIENLKPKYPELFESVLKNKVIRTDISPGDGMFQPAQGSYYFETGLDALRNISAAFSQARKKPESVGEVLDFACGHGRVARMLRAAFPQAHLTVADTDSKGIAFCAETFQAEPVLSKPAVSEIQLDRQYDLIWCGSLLTHLNAPQWSELLRFFHEHLSHQGIVVFTTHGRYVANRLQQRLKMYNLSEEQVVNLLVAYERDGFGYSPYKDGMQYGISVASPSWVVRAIEHYSSFRLLHFVEQGWVQHQDVAACLKGVAGGASFTVPRRKRGVRSPNFLVLGAQKAGTTYLHAHLRKHPEIYLPKTKELNFFSSNHQIKKLGFEAYLKQHFQHVTEENAIGECSPAYFWITDPSSPWCHPNPSHNAYIPAAVYQYLGGDTKFIVSLRNPIDRAVSAYFHHFQRERIQPGQSIFEVGHLYGIIDLGFYYRHLSRWLEVFDRKNFLILFFEKDIEQNPEQTFTRIFDFLGVNNTFQVNDTFAPIYQGLPRQKVQGDVLLVRETSAQSSEADQTPPNSPDLVVDTDDLRKLKALYQDDIRRLAQLLKQDLSDWPSAI